MKLLIAAAQACDRQEMREDLALCIDHDHAAGHSKIVNGATQSNMDELNRGFHECHGQKAKAIDNWRSCSDEERLHAARHVLGLAMSRDSFNQLVDDHQSRYEE